MVQCSVPGCKNSSTKGFLLKRFPRDPERRLQWATNVQKINWKPSNNSYICEVHFDDSQWESKRLDRLKWNAVPTIFHQDAKYTKRKERTLLRVRPQIAQNLSNDSDQGQSQEIHITQMEDYLRGMNDSADTNSRADIHPVGIYDSDNEMFEFSSQIKEYCDKDALIVELRREIAKKDSCLLKYEEIMCQMNSHLEKLKERFKFWRNYRERDKFGLKKVKKLRNSYVA